MPLNGRVCRSSAFLGRSSHLSINSRRLGLAANFSITLLCNSFLCSKFLSICFSIEIRAKDESRSSAIVHLKNDRILSKVEKLLSFETELAGMVKKSCISLTVSDIADKKNEFMKHLQNSFTCGTFFEIILRIQIPELTCQGF